MKNCYVEEVVRSLDKEPEKWSLDLGSFRLVHEDKKVGIWISNGYCGLSIIRGPSEVWGGVTALSSFFLSIDHWRLWRAVQRWHRTEHARIL